MITVRNLVKRFGSEKEVLSGIDFTVKRGELVVLLGASGSGKSTLFRCLTLLERWNEGKFIYAGNDIFSIKRGKRIIRKEWAYIEEHPNLNPRKTALKNVLSGRWFHTPMWRSLTGRVAMDEHVMAMDYLEKVGLMGKADRKVENLSGGELQRVAIAKALIQGAKVIVADEPVSGLDPSSAQQVMLDLQQLCERQNVTVFCSLLHVGLAEQYATRILGLNAGNIVVDIPGRRLSEQEKDLIF